MNQNGVFLIFLITTISIDWWNCFTLEKSILNSTLNNLKKKTIEKIFSSEKKKKNEIKLLSNRSMSVVLIFLNFFHNYLHCFECKFKFVFKKQHHCKMGIKIIYKVKRSY